METVKTCASFAGPAAAVISYVVSKNQLDSSFQQVDTNFKQMQTWSVSTFKSITEEIMALRERVSTLEKKLTASERKNDVFISKVNSLMKMTKSPPQPRKVGKQIIEEDDFFAPVQKKKNVSFVEEVVDSPSKVKLHDEEEDEDDEIFDLSEVEDEGGVKLPHKDDDDGLEDALNTVSSYSKKT